MTPTTHLGDGTPLAPLAVIRARHVRRIQLTLGDALPLRSEGLLTMYVNDEIDWADLLTVKEWLAWTETFEELHGPTPDDPPTHEEDHPMTTALRAQVFAEAIQNAHGRWTYQGRDRQSWDAETDHLRHRWQQNEGANSALREIMRDTQEIADTLLMLDADIRPAPQYRP